MKIASIITFLLSIAPFTNPGVVPAEKFQSILDRMNKARADTARIKKIANMPELSYDKHLGFEVIKKEDCYDAQKDRFLLIPNYATWKKYGQGGVDWFDYAEEMKKAHKQNKADLVIGWSAMRRFDRMMNDTRLSKIGCLFSDNCFWQDTYNGTKLLFKFPMACAVEYSIIDDADKFQKEGKAGSQCPKDKTKNNLCVEFSPPKPCPTGSPGTSGSSGSSGTSGSSGATEPSGSSSSSSKLAPFIILIALLILKFL